MLVESPTTDYFRSAIHAMSLADAEILVSPEAVKRSLKVVRPTLKGRQRKTACLTFRLWLRCELDQGSTGRRELINHGQRRMQSLARIVGYRGLSGDGRR